MSAVTRKYVRKKTEDTAEAKAVVLEDGDEEVLVDNTKPIIEVEAKPVEPEEKAEAEPANEEKAEEPAEPDVVDLGSPVEHADAMHHVAFDGVKDYHEFFRTLTGDAAPEHPYLTVTHTDTDNEVIGCHVRKIERSEVRMLMDVLEAESLGNILRGAQKLGATLTGALAGMIAMGQPIDFDKVLEVRARDMANNPAIYKAIGIATESPIQAFGMLMAIETPYNPATPYGTPLFEQLWMVNALLNFIPEADLGNVQKKATALAAELKVDETSAAKLEALFAPKPASADEIASKLWDDLESIAALIASTTTNDDGGSNKENVEGLCRRIETVRENVTKAKWRDAVEKTEEE